MSNQGVSNQGVSNQGVSNQGLSEQGGEAVLSCRQVCRSFAEAGGRVSVLEGVDLEVAPGERLAIVGSSGSGKSTLLNILSGLDDPTSGEVQLAGQSFRGLGQNQRARLRNRHLGFVYQFHHLLAEFSALENVAMPLLLRGRTLPEVTVEAGAMLAQVGLSDRASHRPGQLSGGERQRVAIARALVGRPDTVLMDEPTGNLDVHTGAEVQALMSALNRDFATAFVVVTHDHALAERMDRVLALDEGRLAPA